MILGTVRLEFSNRRGLSFGSGRDVSHGNFRLQKGAKGQNVLGIKCLGRAQVPGSGDLLHAKASKLG